MANVDTIDVTKLILVEQGSTPASPSAGKQKLYVRTSDHTLCIVDSSGTVSSLGAPALTNPMSHAEAIIVGGTAGAPAELQIGAVGGALSRINGAVAWNSGTANPGSAAAGDRYWRSDLGLEIYYDGTRWLTTTLYRADMPHGTTIPATVTTALGRFAMWHSTYSLYVVTFYTSLLVAATNDGSHYWTVTLAKKDGGDLPTTLAAANTSAYTNTTWTTAATAVGAVVDPATYKEMDVEAVRTSTPGSLYYAVAFTYRLVVT